MQHHYSQLIELFAECFERSYRTRLVAGEDEPYYQPATTEQLAEVVFAHGFFASALHEIAHWCIAGSRRRTQFDYGY
ncbi:transporting ATPase, partial [Pseudidiomarina aestuarii]